MVRNRRTPPARHLRCSTPHQNTRSNPMNRTELSSPVLVTGPSFFGWDTTCILEPVRDPGIYVKLPTGTTVPLSDMTLGVNRFLRFLTLRWKHFILRIP